MKSNHAAKGTRSRANGRPTGTRGKPAGVVRVIGGQWRSRQIEVLDSEGLRPTGDRIRETLFNWLGSSLAGRRCLDLFAGTGVLGLEALSRGAAHVDWVEKSLPAVRQLRSVVNSFQEKDPVSGTGLVHHADALAYLKRVNSQFDLVFLDPPFALSVWSSLWHLLDERVLPGGRVYVEAPAVPTELSPPPRGWLIIRQSTAGAVWFALLQREYSQAPQSISADIPTP